MLWFHEADDSVYKNALSWRNDNIEDIVQVFSIMGSRFSDDISTILEIMCLGLYFARREVELDINKQLA